MVIIVGFFVGLAVTGALGGVLYYFQKRDHSEF